MVRYYLAQYTGSGTYEDPYTPTGGFTDWGSVDARLHGATSGWAFVHAEVTQEEHDTIRAASGVTYVPFEDSLGNPLTLEDTIADLDPTKRSNMQAWLEDRHVPTGHLTLSDTLGAVVRLVRRRFILRQLMREREFTETLNTLVGDLTQTRRQAINAKLTELGFDTSAVTLTMTIREALVAILQQDHPLLPEA